MKVPDDVKNEIIELFCNTHLKSTKILDIVAPNGEITLEDLYAILNEYQEKNKVNLKRKKSVLPILDEEIFKLREQGLTYERIVEHLARQGIEISVSFVSNRCQKIYKEKGKEQPKAKKEKNLIGLEEEIFKLREQGLTYESIAEYFTNQGIQISLQAIGVKCKKIYKEKGKEQPKTIRRQPKLMESEDEVFKLREQGLSYERIAEYFESRGIKVSKHTIGAMCQKIYKEKGKEQPKTKIRKTKLMESEEKIFELREQGLTYEEIVEYFESRGIKVSKHTIGAMCQKIYKEKGKEQPKTKTRKTKLMVSEEEIFELREQGLTYKKIAEYFSNQGIQISTVTIREKCKKIYKEKGKEEPKAKTQKTKLIGLEEEIFKLRAQGLSFRRIASCLNEMGIKVTYETVRKILSNKNQENSKLIELTDVDTIKRLLENLKHSKNATDEQLKKLADLYGIELNIEELIEL